MMKIYKNESALLDKTIENLEKKNAVELDELKENFHHLYSSLKPGNIINNTLVDIRNTADLKQNVLESIISLTGGYFSKKLIFGKSNSVFKKILGSALQFGITNLISKKFQKN